ncbi:MAG: hypothetical protein KKD11_07905 [Candidatus Omnitrophica bacterium]|nr:hypothetical protein [Candidatus Omnitrophota bacterium]
MVKFGKVICFLIYVIFLTKASLYPFSVSEDSLRLPLDSSVIKRMETAFSSKMLKAEKKLVDEFTDFLDTEKSNEFKEELKKFFPETSNYNKAIEDMKYILLEVHDEDAEYILMQSDRHVIKENLFVLKDGKIDFEATAGDQEKLRLLFQVIENEESIVKRYNLPDKRVLRAMKALKGIKIDIPGHPIKVDLWDAAHYYWSSVITKNEMFLKDLPLTSDIDLVRSFAVTAAMEHIMYLRRGKLAINQTFRDLKLPTRSADEKKKISLTTQRIMASMDPAFQIAVDSALPKVMGNAILKGLLDFNETYFELFERAVDIGVVDYDVGKPEAKKVGSLGIMMKPGKRGEMDNWEREARTFKGSKQEGFSMYDGEFNENKNFNAFLKNQGPAVSLIQMTVRGINIDFRANKAPYFEKHGLIIVEPEKNYPQELNLVTLEAVDAIREDLDLDKRFRIGMNPTDNWGGKVHHGHLHIISLPEEFDVAPIENSERDEVLENNGIGIHKLTGFVFDGLMFSGRGDLKRESAMNHVLQIMYQNKTHGVVWGLNGEVYIVRAADDIEISAGKICETGMGVGGKMGIFDTSQEKVYSSITQEKMINQLTLLKEERPMDPDTYFSAGFIELLSSKEVTESLLKERLESNQSSSKAL